jgi:hypothetical protein
MKEHRAPRQFRFGALGDLQDVLTHRRGVCARGDWHDIGQEFGRGGVRNERGPARFQIKQLRRDMMRNEFRERRYRRRPVPFAAQAAVKPWTRQPHVAKQCVEYDGIVAFASPPAVANLAAPSPFGPALGLGLDNPLLRSGKQNLALGEGQSKIFGVFDALVQGCDFLDAVGRAVISRDLKQNLHAHGVLPVGQNRAGDRRTFARPLWRRRVAGPDQHGDGRHSGRGGRLASSPA